MSFSYTYRAGFIFIWGVPLTIPSWLYFLSGQFLLHIPWVALFFFGEFLLYISCCLFLYFLFRLVSLTHPVLALFLCGEFLLHLHCFLSFSLESFCYTSHTGFFSFNLGSFSYTSRAGFILFFMWAVSLTHPVLASLSREFLSYIPCRLHFLSW